MDTKQISRRYWLMKSEPSEYSIDDLARDKRAPWYGVRNYQARNYMRDVMQPGDAVLFYHSSCPEPGVAGLAEVVGKPYPDATQFDPSSHYFDPKATKEKPRWTLVDVKFKKRFIQIIPLSVIRREKKLQDMIILRPGNRLSITPITEAEAIAIEQLTVTTV
jgi:predicted RNA-binding protein with PUA-like domain